MPLDLTQLLNIDSWRKARKQQPQKLLQVHWFEKFHAALYDLKHISNASVGYLSLADFVYTEGTPLFHWFKFTKNGAFILHSYDSEDWKYYTPDESVRKILLGSTINKWKPIETELLQLEDYILFPIQRMSAELKIIIPAMKWAKENKKLILFRPHPYPSDTIDQTILWNKLKDVGLVSEYTVFSRNGTAEDAVDSCNALWTSNSGLGLQGIIKQKPVAYFHKDVDHTYGPIATYCKNIKEATEAEAPSLADIDKYLTWYYNEVVIDLSTNNYKEKIRDRILGI